MRERGFTLLELLVTLVIIGIAVSTVALSINSRKQHEFDLEVERLAALFQMAQDEARLTARSVVWVADVRGYHFEPIQSDESRPLPQELLAVRHWPVLAQSVDPARIQFGQEPLMNPVTLNLVTAQEHIHLRLNALGHLEKMR